MTKWCMSCQQTLPLDAFPSSPSSPDGRRSTCTACIEQRKARTEKPCDRCGTIKPLSDFPRNSASFDGHRHTCQGCLQGERDRTRAHQRQVWLATHLLGGSLETLAREFGPQCSIQLAGKPDQRSIPDLLERIRRQAPDKLTLRVEIRYEEMYDVATETGWIGPGACLASIWRTEQGRPARRIYEIYSGAPQRAADALEMPPADAPPPSAPPEMTPPPQSAPPPPSATSSTPPPQTLPTSAWSPGWRGAQRPPVHRSPTQWRQWARDLLATADEPWIILDTETTGVRRDAELVEVAAVDLAGSTLANVLIRPARPIPPDATGVHGITNTMVADALPFADAYTQTLSPLLATHHLLVFNAQFDIPLLQRHILRACDIHWTPKGQACLMKAYIGFNAGLGRYSLADACAHLGITRSHAHRALGDCLDSLEVLRAMAR